MSWVSKLKVGDKVVVKKFCPNGKNPSYNLMNVDSISNGKICVGKYVFLPPTYSIFNKQSWIRLLNPNNPVIRSLLRKF